MPPTSGKRKASLPMYVLLGGSLGASMMFSRLLLVVPTIDAAGSTLNEVAGECRPTP